MGLKLDIVLTLNNADAVASGLTNVGTKVEGVGVKVRKSGKELEDGLGGVGAQLQRMQGFLLGFVAFDKLTDWAGQAIQMADGWALLNAKLEVATGSSTAAQASMGELYNLAQDLRVPLSETATLFGRLTPALREFGGGTAEAMRMTEALSLSLKVSGATQAEAGSAMLQFSQAMSAGALRGEEFNSMADAAPRLLQALADGLGVSRGALKGLAEEGKLTTDVVYAALANQVPVLEKEFSKLPLTVGDAWTKIGNATMKGIGEFNQGAKLTEKLATALDSLSNYIPPLINGIVLLTELTTAYFVVVKGGPMILAGAKAAMVALSEAQALLALATMDNTKLWDVFTLNLSKSPGIIKECSTGLGALKVAGSLAMAGFAGWEIGTYLHENFEFARVSGIAFVSALLTGWEQLKYYGQAAWEVLKFGFLNFFIEPTKQQFSGFLGLIADGLGKIGKTDLAEKFQGWSDSLAKPAYSAQQLDGRLKALGDTRDKELALINTTIDAMYEDEIQRNNVSTATSKLNTAQDTLNKTSGLSAKESEKLQTKFDKLTKALGDQTTSLQLSANGQKQLTKTQELTAKASEFLTSMGDKLTKSQKSQLQAFMQSLPQLEKQSDAALKLAKAQEEHKRKLDDSLKSLDAELQKAIEERDSLGKTEVQVRQLSVQRDKETLAVLQARAAKETNNQALQHEISVLTQRIAKGQELIVVLNDASAWEAQQKQIKENTESWNTFSGDIGRAFTDGFQRMLEDGKGGWDSFTDSIKNTFKRAVVDYLYKALAQPMLMNIGAVVTGTGAQAAGVGGSNAGLGMLGSGGVWGMVAVGAIAAASAWNQAQDKKYEHLNAEYRQATQSTGTVLGYADAKSESLGKSLDRLANVAGDTLDVNYGMYDALLAIQEGISGTAAGFSRTLGMTNGNIVGGIKTGSSTYSNGYGQFGEGKVIASGLYGIDDDIVSGFLNGLANKISSGIYNKKVKITDAGIQFAGEALADVMASGTLDAFNYATVKTTKKVLGINAGTKVKTETSDLDDVVQGQFASVFANAGFVLKQAATAFSIDTESYLKQLRIDPQQLSLKDKTGDELTKELEAFISANLDKWAGQMVAGTDILNEFQEVGEGAFETVIRLASEVNTFNSYATKLNLSFKQTGVDAIRATQAISAASGGFDQLTRNLSSYYENFFTEAERSEHSWNSLSEHLKELGFDTIPKTREQFRALVEAQDLTTDAGQRQFAALVAVSGAFAELVPETVAMLDLTGSRFADFVTTLGSNWETAFSVMGDASVVARQKLIDLSGGIDALSEKIGFYYENFYSDSEKNARVFAELDAKLDMLGVTLELNKESFRGLMESIDITANPEGYAALLDIAPMFSQLIGKMGDSAAGQSIGIGVNASGVSDQQLASINLGAENWWKTYQPEFQAQTDQAVKTTDAIVNLTRVTESSSETLRTEVANGNALLVAAIHESNNISGSNNTAVIDAISSMSRQTVSAVENAVLSSTLQ